MELGNGWYCLTTVDIPKKYWLRRTYARNVHHRFWLAPYERLNLRSTKYKLKHSLDLNCFEIKRNVDDVFNQHTLYYKNYWLHERVTLEIVTLRKPMSLHIYQYMYIVVFDLQINKLETCLIWILLLTEKVYLYVKKVSIGTRTQGPWRTVSALYPLSYWDPIFWPTFTHLDTRWHLQKEIKYVKKVKFLSTTSAQNIRRATLNNYSLFILSPTVSTNHYFFLVLSIAF